MMEHAIIKSLFYGEFSELEGKISPQTQEQKTMLHELDALLGDLLEKLSPDDKKSWRILTYFWASFPLWTRSRALPMACALG